ncbi:MAG: hypothetical protein WC148_01470 [Bacilli bacterium]
MKYQITKHNDEVVFIDIDNGDKLKATLSNFGAGVFKLRYDDLPMILEIEDKDTWLHQPCFYGKTLARVAGRIRCEGDIDGEPYHLKETTAGYSLHGGEINSLSFRPWKYEVKEYKEKLDVIFSITSRNNDNGFPGVAKIKVIYEIYKKTNNFRMIYKGTTNTKTLLNISNHNYYNLFNSPDVSDYTLKVNANKYGEIDNTVFITNTNKVPWYLDFERATKLKQRLDYIEKKTWIKTIDNTFIFNNIMTNKPQVVMKNKDVKLSMFTDYPTLNIFCDNFHNPVKFFQFKTLDNGRRAIALEPQLYDLDHDSLIVRKGDKYKHFILLKFKDLRK